MPTFSAGIPVLASWPSSVRTSVAVSVGAATVGGVLAAGVVWASQLWLLPWGDEWRAGDVTRWDPDSEDNPDGWGSDPEEDDDPDGWSLDLDSDRSRWRLFE